MAGKYNLARVVKIDLPLFLILPFTKLSKDTDAEFVAFIDDKSNLIKVCLRINEKDADINGEFYIYYLGKRYIEVTLSIRREIILKILNGEFNSLDIEIKEHIYSYWEPLKKDKFLSDGIDPIWLALNPSNPSITLALREYLLMRA